MNGECVSGQGYVGNLQKLTVNSGFAVVTSVWTPVEGRVGRCGRNEIGQTLGKKLKEQKFSRF